MKNQNRHLQLHSYSICLPRKKVGATPQKGGYNPEKRGVQPHKKRGTTPILEGFNPSKIRGGGLDLGLSDAGLPFCASLVFIDASILIKVSARPPSKISSSNSDSVINLSFLY